MDFLKTLKVPSPVFPNEENALVVLNSDASVVDGFQTLISNNILSVPIYDARSKTYTQSLSMVDVVLHALESLNDADLDSGVCSAISIFSGKEAFRHAKVHDIAGKSRQTPVTIDSLATVDRVVEVMVKTKAHQILGLGDKGELANIITQSRIIECISSLFGIDPALTLLGEKTVRELGMGMQDVLSINEDAKAADAFRMLADRNVSGIAVVRGGGGSKALVGNVSVRDLRIISSNARFLKLLSLPVSEYLEMARNEYSMPKSVVSCGAEDTYRTVLQRIVQHRVHRCYIVDPSNQLLGVISLWDLLKQLVSPAQSVNAP